MAKVTLKQARTMLRYLGLTLVKRDDEFVVKFKGTSDDAPNNHFTNDLEDAVASGRDMAARAAAAVASKMTRAARIESAVEKVGLNYLGDSSSLSVAEGILTVALKGEYDLNEVRALLKDMEAIANETGYHDKVKS